MNSKVSATIIIFITPIYIPNYNKRYIKYLIRIKDIKWVIVILKYKFTDWFFVNNIRYPLQMFDELRINLILLILNIVALGNFVYPSRK